MRLACFDTPGWFLAGGGSGSYCGGGCCVVSPKDRVSAAGAQKGKAGGGLSWLVCHHL